MRRWEQSGMPCSTFLPRAPHWGHSRTSSCPNRQLEALLLAQFRCGFNKPLKLPVSGLILLKMITWIIFGFEFCPITKQPFSENYLLITYPTAIFLGNKNKSKAPLAVKEVFTYISAYRRHLTWTRSAIYCNTLSPQHLL